MRRVYLDHSATTPMEPRVIEAMMPYFNIKFGNPSSIHTFGREAKVALEEARETAAGIINSNASEIFFTSGGTEADNLAIKGVASLLKEKGNHIITSKIEHHAILHTCEYLERQGFEVTYIKPDKYGMVSPEQVAEAITDKTILVTIMHANNEVGTINPIAEIGKVTSAKKTLFHVDAVQSFGKLEIDVSKLPVDLMSFSGHKIYGPKGIGALFVRKGIRLEKIMHGGAHERNRRAGTENLAGIIGFAKAVEICQQNMKSESKFILELRDALFHKLQNRVPKIVLNGHPKKRLYSILNVSFEGIEGESLLLSLDLKGIAVSSGSACTSGAVDPSHVLSSMGIRPELSQSSIRFSIGRGNTMEDIDYVVEQLPPIVERLRAMSPLG